MPPHPNPLPRWGRGGRPSPAAFPPTSDRGAAADPNARVPRPFRPCLIALQFLTRLPSPVQFDASSAEIGDSLTWFPLVGLSIGALCLAVDRLADQVVARPAANAILVWLLVAITGALHVDGLMDSADGLSSGPDASARLAAMRRSTVGAPGALAGCVLFLAVFAALSALDGDARSMALLLAPLCGRSAIILGYGAFPYPRAEPGWSRFLKDGATAPRVGAGLVSGAGAAFAVAGAPGLLLLALALALGLGLGRLALTRVPGLTGDNHGAICELAQLAVLVAAPAVLAR